MRPSEYRISVSAEAVGENTHDLDRPNRFATPQPSVHEQAFGADDGPSVWELRVQALRREVERLPDLERAVMRGRLGYEDRGEETLRDISRRLGIPLGPVWRLEKQALARLRYALNPVGWPAPEPVVEELRAA